MNSRRSLEELKGKRIRINDNHPNECLRGLLGTIIISPTVRNVVWIGKIGYDGSIVSIRKEWLSDVSASMDNHICLYLFKEWFDVTDT